MNMQTRISPIPGAHDGLLDAEDVEQVFFESQKPRHAGIFAGIRDVLERYEIAPNNLAIRRLGLVVPLHTHFHIGPDETILNRWCDGSRLESVVVPHTELPEGARVHSFRVGPKGPIPLIYSHPDVRDIGPASAPPFNPFEHTELCDALYRELLAAPAPGPAYASAVGWVGFYVMEKWFTDESRVPGEIIYVEERRVVVTVEGDPADPGGMAGIPVAFQLHPGNSPEVMIKYTVSYVAKPFHTEKKHEKNG
jgi:hypothetical protein